MTVGIVGLGLIGGSMAKAYSRAEGVRVLAVDTDRTVLGFAMLAGAVDGELTEENLPDCDLLLLASYPEGAETYLRRNAGIIGKKTTVVDCLGTKRAICAMAFPLAREHGFTFVGGHPMAGTQYSGFKYARENLFKGAPMVLVPPPGFDMELLDRLKTLLAPAMFGSFTVTTAEAHDEMIAFTSQMPHLISNAFIKSPAAAKHRGFSAGSYKDMTRVAWLKPGMWTELFLENRDKLTAELDAFIGSLQEYREALAEQDGERLQRLLQEGCMRKKEIDGR
jgi:prephenate dehydrogenase